MVCRLRADSLCPEHGGSIEANARLIASAPDLLAALEDAFDMLRLMGVDMTGHEMTRQIGNAIAKAKGTQ